jgi:hypothetical protein
LIRPTTILNVTTALPVFLNADLPDNLECEARARRRVWQFVNFYINIRIEMVPICTILEHPAGLTLPGHL